jgi:hypothetical protein
MGLISNATTIFDAGVMSAGGSMVFIKKLTASNSATLSFVNGADSVVLNSTYKEYMFFFDNIHVTTDDAYLTVGFRDGGTAYDAIKTTTAFRAFHFEDDSNQGVTYQANEDLAQSTNFQNLGQLQGNGNDVSGAGYMHLFNPASTTFAKHFISNYSHHYTNAAPGNINNYVAGYCNVTAAIDAVQFKLSSGNFDTGVIRMYGIA